MKKILPAFLVLLVLLLVVSLFIFPREQHPGGSLTAAIPYSAAMRLMPDTTLWKNWWPWGSDKKQGSQPEGQISLKGFAETQFVLNWEENGILIPVLVTLGSKGNDSTVVAWSASWEAGLNPFNRINAFARGRRLKNDMQNLLAAFGLYASNPENVYGFKPVFTKVTDTLLISTKLVFDTLPGTKEIYTTIGKLEQFAKSRGAAITGLPMYHITPSGKAFEMMVALPISKSIEGNEAYRIKRMVDGHLLVTEVKAGPEKLRYLYQQFEQFKNDNQLVSPAIPYLQPVTNRLQQPDTAQWVTKMCYPIF